MKVVWTAHAEDRALDRFAPVSNITNIVRARKWDLGVNRIEIDRWVVIFEVTEDAAKVITCYDVAECQWGNDIRTRRAIRKIKA